MRPQQTETGKDQDHPSKGPRSSRAQDTMEEEGLSPLQTSPAPPQRRPRPRSSRPFWWIDFAVVLVLLLSIGAVLAVYLGQPAGKQSMPTPPPRSTPIVPPTSSADLPPRLEPGAVLGPQACPGGVSDPMHWGALVGMRGSDRKEEKVSCANLLLKPSLQALVTVRHVKGDSPLDVYVFNNITSAKPMQIFTLQGLVKGEASISGFNTVMTAKVDRGSAVNVGKSSSQWTADLFRDFGWNGGKRTLVQVAFPGIFPDLTRYQAEADQVQGNFGQQSWKMDPAQVAQQLAVSFLGWSRPVKATLTNGGGAQDVTATVNVEEAPAQGAPGQKPHITIMLSHLEGNTHYMWVVIAVYDPNTLTLENIKSGRLIASPVKLAGKGRALYGVIGKAVVLDHLYNVIGHVWVTTVDGTGMGNTAYSNTVTYTTTFRSGAQEGIIVVLEVHAGINEEPFSAVMVKVLLDPGLSPGWGGGRVLAR